jgi:hypothetical protein
MEHVVTLNPEDIFTVAQYPYTRFRFGTDRAYAARYNNPEPEAGIPWANPQEPFLSAERQEPEPIAARLAFGWLVTTPGYGTYRLERDHNRNVKFVEVTGL